MDDEERVPNPELADALSQPSLSAKVATLLATMPNASIRDYLREIIKEDPVIWAMLHRKIRGRTFICDNSKALSSSELTKLKNRIKNQSKFDVEKKIRLQRHRPFLEQPLRDNHKHKVYMKGRQVGVSEISLIEVLWFLATNNGTKWVITFPRDGGLQTFVNSRINPALIETPAIKKLVGSPNQIYMKKIGESFLILKSSWEPTLGEGIDADGLTMDEKDRMNSNVEHAFKEALASSIFGWTREISTPSLPGRGIHELFDKSDQQTWLVRCSVCNLEQAIDHEENIVQIKDWKQGVEDLPEESFEYQCRLQKCRGVLNRMFGRWVAKYPSKATKNHGIRGYHMPQMIFVLADATDLMRKRYDGRTLQAWLNYEVGVPASGDSVLLNENDYDLACSRHVLLEYKTADWVEITVGIDWGAPNSWVIVLGLNSNGYVYIIGIKQFVDNAEPLESTRLMGDYIEAFQPSLVVGDDGFGKDRNAYMLKRFGEGKFFSCKYDSTPRSAKALESARAAAKARYQPRWSTDEVALVSVDRTTELKKTCHAIKSKEIGTPSYDIYEASLWRKHMMNLVPMQIEDPETKELVEVVDKKGPDHLAHCLNYARIAMLRLAQLGQFTWSLG